MKAMKKTVGKKPMMKAKKGMSVADPGNPAKKSQLIGAGTIIGGALAGVGKAIGQARTKKLIKKYNEAARTSATSDTATGDTMTQKAKYAAKLQKRGIDVNKRVNEEKDGGTKYKTGGMVNSNKKVSAIKSAGSKGVKSRVNKKAIVKRK